MEKPQNKVSKSNDLIEIRFLLTGQVDKVSIAQLDAIKALNNVPLEIISKLEPVSVPDVVTGATDLD